MAGLKLYNSSKLEISFGSMAAPLRSSHDGKDGSVYIVKVFVRNDDSNFYYQSVTLTPIDKSASGAGTLGAYGDGTSIKLAYGSTLPLPAEWSLINSGDAVQIPVDIGSSSGVDTTTYFPIWVRISIPGNSDVEGKSNLALRLRYVKRPTA